MYMIIWTRKLKVHGLDKKMNGVASAVPLSYGKETSIKSGMLF
ncbi:hypothetical protein FHS15_004919 [Paenibacillus castaneae]|nr:hypothetical protein [Paenibacillus castaneae]